ncbi:unnamed protein product, partial [Ectocarpus sp. 12 AP-2014]
LLSHLGWDILALRWPPFSPPVGWGPCVESFRRVLGRPAVLNPELRALEGYGIRGRNILARWERQVHTWARDVDAGVNPGEFPVFPTGEEDEAWAGEACEHRPRAAGGLGDDSVGSPDAGHG